MGHKNKYNEKGESYVLLWLKYKEEHQDMPLRENFPDKKSYRKAKNKWNFDNSDISEYLLKRFDYFFKREEPDMIENYKNLIGFYSKNSPG
jgi:hypothetical protein